MPEARPSQVWRSIAAVGAGFVLVVVLSLSADAVLHAAGVFPGWGRPMSDKLFLLATVYRTIYGVAGSYLTARLAPSRPMQHALVGGAIGMVIATAGAVATWNRGPEFGPHWYPLTRVATAIPQAWIGAKGYEMQAAKAVGDIPR